jgi:hypothetical protein
MARSGWAAVAVAIVLVGVLGSEAALDAAADAGRRTELLLSSLTAFPAWHADAYGGDSDIYPAVVAKTLVLVVALFLLAYTAGRSASPTAAFLAGWGSVLVACAGAAAVFSVVAELTADDALPDLGGSVNRLVAEVNAGAAFAMYAGWIVGVAVMVARATRVAPSMLPSTVGSPPTPSSPPAPPPPAALGGQPGSVAPPASQPAPTPVATWPPSPAWTPQHSPLPATPPTRRDEREPGVEGTDRVWRSSDRSSKD